MQVVFLGTPDFAVNALKAIVGSSHKVLAVVCQPDRTGGRGNKVIVSPVKEFALYNNIKVLQYNSISKEGVEDLKNLKPDIMITCAFGQILSQEIIDIAPNGIINIHGSLLPKYRGASPIQSAIINGEKETGITIMQTTAGIDSGDIILQKKTEIGVNETSGELFERLSVMGAELIVEALDKIMLKTATFTPQNESEMTKCSMLKKQDFILDFSKNSKSIIDMIRGANPWPISYFIYNNEIIKVYSAKIFEDELIGDYAASEVVLASSIDGLVVKTQDGFVELLEIQAQSSKRMSARNYLNGKKIVKGTIL